MRKKNATRDLWGDSADPGKSGPRCKKGPECLRQRGGCLLLLRHESEIVLAGQGYLYSQEHSLALTHSRGLPGSSYCIVTQLHGLPQADNTQKKKEKKHIPDLSSFNDCIIPPASYKSDESTHLGSSQSANLTKQLPVCTFKEREGLHRSTAVSHLLGWMGVVQTDNKKKKRGSNQTESPFRVSHHTFRLSQQPI